jgi:hypothetical protein
MSRLAAFALLLVAFPALAASPPALTNYQGVLRGAADEPLTGDYDMVFRFFDAETGGDEILLDRHLASNAQAVTVNGGLFAVALGSGEVIDGSGPGTYASMADLFRDHSGVWLGNRVLFLANDGIAGEEPWVAHTAIVFGRPDRAIEDLKSEVRLLHLALGIETSLSTFLSAAARDLAADRTVPAILSLEAFGRYLGALTPAKVSEGSAADLQEFAAAIVSLLEGSSKPAIP